VLEIGAGTGINLRFYDPGRVSHLTLSDLDDRRLVLGERVRRDRPELAGRVTVTRIDAQRLPFPDGAFDTVVATLLFCSVECPPCGFDEIARVLSPEGRYLFLEHVRPEHPRLARVFDSINPLWNGVSRGCNLNRDTIGEIGAAGFTITRKRRDRNGVFVWGEARHDPDR
jgi:ubiquinone/menaquinone biosynthesis C-methylase UbiE